MLCLCGNWKNRSWERPPAGIQGKAPHPSHGCRGDSGLWLLGSAKWKEQVTVREGARGKESFGGVAILQQIVAKQEQPQRKGQHEKGDEDKAA